MLPTDEEINWEERRKKGRGREKRERAGEAEGAERTAQILRRSKGKGRRRRREEEGQFFHQEEEERKLGAARRRRRRRSFQRG